MELKTTVVLVSKDIIEENVNSWSAPESSADVVGSFSNKTIITLENHN